MAWPGIAISTVGTPVASNYVGITGNNIGAGAGGSTHKVYNYNPGPVYPVPRALDASSPYNVVWYSWYCPASGNYYFSTRRLSATTPATDYLSTIQAFDGGSLATLGEETYLMNQSVGDGDGMDNGASVAFAAVSGTTYYIAVDGRYGATGHFVLTWGIYNQTTLGACGTLANDTVNTDPTMVCVGSVEVPNNLATDAWFSFGPQPPSGPALPGNYRVVYIRGQVIPQYANAVYPAPQVFPNITIIDGDMTGFTEWSNTGVYTTGAAVIQLINQNDYVAGIAQGPVTVGVPPYTAGSCNNPPWTCLNDTDTIPKAVCAWSSYISSPIPHTTGVIGIAYLAGGTTGTGGPATDYMLVYFPMDATVLNGSAGFASFSGSGTSWTISFNVQNNSSQAWDQVTATLLATGGVSSPSSAITGLSLTAGAATPTGNFTFTATPGMVTASIQLSRNGVVACVLAFPLYPMVSLAFLDASYGSGLNMFERNCTPKAWVQGLRLTGSWPPSGSAAFPAGWGDTLDLVFANSAGTMTNDKVNACTPVVTSITAAAISIPSGGSHTDRVIEADFAVNGSVQSVPINCTVEWDGPNIFLPTFSQTLSIPAT